MVQRGRRRTGVSHSIQKLQAGSRMSMADGLGRTDNTHLPSRRSLNPLQNLFSRPHAAGRLPYLVRAFQPRFYVSVAFCLGEMPKWKGYQSG